jgi:hypothetical protein
MHDHAPPVPEEGSVAPAQEGIRATARHPSGLPIFCEPLTIGDSEDGYWGWAQDISSGGIRLTIDRRFAVGAMLILELPSACLLAKVIHEAPSADGRWSVGCSFARLLGEAEVRALREES